MIKRREIRAWQWHSPPLTYEKKDVNLFFFLLPIFIFQYSYFFHYLANVELTCLVDFGRGRRFLISRWMGIKLNQSDGSAAIGDELDAATRSLNCFYMCTCRFWSDVHIKKKKKKKLEGFRRNPKLSCCQITVFIKDVLQMRYSDTDTHKK